MAQNIAFEEKVLQALKGLEINIQILHSHTQSIVKLEIQIGQLATAFNRREEDKLLSQPISNPRGQHMAESSNTYEIFSEHAKSIMILRNGKVIEQPSKTTKPETQNPTRSESSKEKEDPKLREEPTPPVLSYLP